MVNLRLHHDAFVDVVEGVRGSTEVGDEVECYVVGLSSEASHWWWWPRQWRWRWVEFRFVGVWLCRFGGCHRFYGASSFVFFVV